MKGPVPWDECNEDELLQKWLDYFRMLVALNDIKFPRSYKPNHTDGSVLPTLVTFGDGNPNSCGATYSARLKDWICVNSDTQFDDHYHFIDSSIVQAMIKKTSYGFNTFAGLRIGEIQQKTNEDKWLHIESSQNIADILTRGAAPNLLVAGSSWQNGPEWLSLSSSEWPVSLACDFKDPVIYQEIQKFQLKYCMVKGK